MSILEEATVAALRPMMRVCNNFVIYRQDVPNQWASVIRTSPTAGHGVRKAIVFGTASKYWRCLKVKAVEWVWDPRGIGKPVLPIGRSHTDQTLKTKPTCEAWVPIERAQLRFFG
jgi:hypothetical protein